MISSSSISYKYKSSVYVLHTEAVHFDTYIACVYDILYQSLRITEGRRLPSKILVYQKTL